MARTKGSKNKAPLTSSEVELLISKDSTSGGTFKVINTTIHPLAVDYSSEGLNDIARKINEIITRINYGL